MRRVSFFLFLILVSGWGLFAAEPDDFPGLQVWLKPENVTKNADNRVSIWHNEPNPGKKDFFQFNAANQPLWVENELSGYPALRFSDNQFLDSMAIPELDGSEITAFIVFRTDDPSKQQDMLFNSYKSGAGKKSGRLWGTSTEFGHACVLARKSNGAPKTLFHKIKKNWVIHSMVWNSKDELRSWLNGKGKGPEKNVNANPSGHIRARIGAAGNKPSISPRDERTDVEPAGTPASCRHEAPSIGNSTNHIRLCEIIIYNTALADADRESIEKYLYDKYLAGLYGPKISSVSAFYDPKRVIITFDKPVDKTEAENPFNYSIDAGMTITAAFQSDDAGRVNLTLDTALSERVAYTLTVNNLQDAEGNTIKPGTSEKFDFVNIPENELTLWLRADGKVFTDKENNVLSWSDHSGNSNHLKSENKPDNCPLPPPIHPMCPEKNDPAPLFVPDELRGKPVIRFDGVRDYLMRSFIPELETDTLTWFVVFRVNDETKRQVILRNAYARGAKSSSKKMWGSLIENSELTGHAMSQKGQIRAVRHSIDTEWHMHSVTWKSDDEIEALVDGEESLTLPGADALPVKHLDLYIGMNSDPVRRNYLNGDIAEILIYASELFPDERQAVETYLKSKYFFDPDDTDADGLLDSWEMEHFGSLGQGPEDDPDGDGLTNLEEFNAGTNPNNADSDGDGISDKDELAMGLDPNNPDQDNDQLSDGWEIKYFGNLNQTAEGDPDSDGVNNIMEFKQGRHPNAGSKSDTENKLKLDVLLPLR